MKIVRRIFILLIFATMLPSVSLGQASAEEEAAARLAFRDAFQEIINAMNTGSMEPFIAAIDENDLLDRIYGLRLIDQKVKRQFQGSFVQDLPRMISSEIADTEGGIRASLLGFASRGDRGRAVVRYDFANFQFNYQEYDLRLDENGRPVIIDWFDFLQGERFSEGMGNTLVMALPGKNAVRKLVDFKNISEHEIFQLTELLKTARDRRVDKYFEIAAGLDDKLKRQRIVVLSGVHLTKVARDRRKMRSALISMAKYFPEEPLYTLMLLDYYFPSKKYAEAMQSLLLLEQRLDVEDAAMKARLSAAALIMGDPDNADKYAESAVTLEPGLELGWWSALRARLALSQFDRSVEALQQLQQRFGRALGPAELQGQKAFEKLLASEEYKVWAAAGSD